MVPSSQFSQSRYERLRPLLLESLQRFRKTGRPTRDFIRYATLRFGVRIRPYLHRIFVDLCTPKPVDIPPDKRQAMIAETAYLLAEKTGFQGDSQGFWQQAERLVDERLARTTITDTQVDDGENHEHRE